MERGVLLLADPLRRGSRFSQMKMQCTTLVFDENERYLSQAQLALHRARKEREWICVAASGAAVGIALALAAQLPVDRLALWMDDTPQLRPRQILRIDAYARRNLALVVSEILLIDAREDAARRLARGLGRSCGIRCMDSGGISAAELTAPWRGEMFFQRR